MLSTERSIVSYFFLIQFRAVNGHGWNTNSNQPFDPNLKVGKVFANQHSNKEQADNTQLDKKKLELLEASKFKVCQLEETIMILKEENAKIKQLYISNVSTNKNSNAPDNHQVLSLQQQIRAMNSNLEDKNQIIISLNATNGMLRFKLSNQIIFSEETIRNLKEENDKLKTLKWELERNNQMTQRLNDKIMILEADLAAEKNRTVGRVNGGMVDSATVYDVESHLESLPTSQSTLCKTCCVIM